MRQSVRPSSVLFYVPLNYQSGQLGVTCLRASNSRSTRFDRGSSSELSTPPPFDLRPTHVMLSSSSFRARPTRLTCSLPPLRQPSTAAYRPTRPRVAPLPTAWLLCVRREHTCPTRAPRAPPRRAAASWRHAHAPSAPPSAPPLTAQPHAAPQYEWVVVFGAIAACFAAFGIGANDVANA